MVPSGVIGLLKRYFPEVAEHTAKQTIKTFGLSEAAVDERLADFDFSSLGVSVGFYPVFPENHVVLIARAPGEEQAQKNLEKATDAVAVRLADCIFAYGEKSLEESVAGIFTQKKLTLAVAESCTGGLVANRLTDVPGSSAFFERGAVTYSNQAKIDLLNVSVDIIGKHGAVSEETARAMAEGVRRMAKTDIGLSITGIAGPSGGTKEKPVGTVFIAVADNRQTICRHHSFRWDRRRNKLISSEAALVMLKNFLEDENK